MRQFLKTLFRDLHTPRQAPEYISLTATIRTYTPETMDDPVVEFKGPGVDLTMTPEVARRIGEDLIAASLCAPEETPHA